MPDPPPPVELPMLGSPPERGDAALNRQRILDAARTLVDTRGPAGVSLDAVAALAGVGKGTIYRRFGDRAGLMQALVSDYMRSFQDEFLAGPPPLGPGAPPAQRLEAFMVALVALQRRHLSTALAAELRSGQPPTSLYGVLRLHVTALIQEHDPTAEAQVLAPMILGATAPPVLSRLDADIHAVNAAVIMLLRGITGPRPGPSRAMMSSRRPENSRGR